MLIIQPANCAVNLIILKIGKLIRSIVKEKRFSNNFLQFSRLFRFCRFLIKISTRAKEILFSQKLSIRMKYRLNSDKQTLRFERWKIDEFEERVNELREFRVLKPFLHVLCERNKSNFRVYTQQSNLFICANF